MLVVSASHLFHLDNRSCAITRNSQIFAIEVLVLLRIISVTYCLDTEYSMVMKWGTRITSIYDNPKSKKNNRCLK